MLTDPGQLPQPQQQQPTPVPFSQTAVNPTGQDDLQSLLQAINSQRNAGAVGSGEQFPTTGGGRPVGSGVSGGNPLKTALDRLKTASSERPSPYVPPQPDSRMDIYRNLLSDFIWSLGQGMKARPQGHGAGIGEALEGPWTLEQLKLNQEAVRQANELRMAQAERDRAASEQTMAKIQEAQTKLPALLQEILSRTNKNEAQTGLATANTNVANARVGEVQATTAKDLQQAMAGRIIKVGNSAFRLSDLIAPDASNVQPVAMDGVSIQVTPQMAAQLGNPELAGKTVSAKVGQELTSMISSMTKTTQTGEGVISRNLATGQTTNIGSPVSFATPREVIGPNGIPRLDTAGNAMRTGEVPGTISDVNKLTGQVATFNNFHSNLNRVRDLLPAIDQPGASSHIASAMAELNNLHPTIGISSTKTGIPWAEEFAQYLKGKFATGVLTDKEYDLINSLSTLREDSFALRQFFGNSPMRSDKQVQIMLNQIPDIADLSTGNSNLVARKLDNFERSVHAVEASYGPLMSIVKGGAGAAVNKANNPTPLPSPARATTSKEPEFVVGPGGMMIRNPKFRGNQP